MKRLLIFILFSFVFLLPNAWAKEPIRIGSKHFTENYLLAEMMSQLLEARGYSVERVQGLGGTMVCFEALRNGELDVYPEYTGTLLKQILKIKNENKMSSVLKERYDLEILPAFGFNNSYAIALNEDLAEEKGLKKISDLKYQYKLKGGLSYEFLRREDGWEDLAAAYRLSNRVMGMEHGLAYEALRHDQTNFTDAYTTDAKIERYNLRLLEDDLNFFPIYKAVPFVQSNLPEKVKSILSLFENQIDEATMTRLNAQVEINKFSFAEVARTFLKEKGWIKKKLIPVKLSAQSPIVVAPQAEKKNKANVSLLKELSQNCFEHLFMVLVALSLGVVVAIPIGVLAYRNEQWAHFILPLTGLLQTIPSIALLALMIPLFGIGMLPAIVALFLYSLLPIVRNTYVGLNGIEAVYRDTARALGMTPKQRLWEVELRLAYPTLLAGIKTAAIINIGTATLAAFIGAGGLGEPIVTGLALNNHQLILQGAIPAAVLAIGVELLFRLFDPKKQLSLEQSL